MKISRNQRTIQLAGLTAWAGLGWMTSCSSSDEAPGGGHIAHPTEPPSKTPSPHPSTTPSTPTASASAIPAPPPRRRSLSETYEELTGTKLSTLDKTILDDCPDRAWSKNVPKRACTKDDECGDGFCDRGRCAAIWTCAAAFGQRCESASWCSTNLCIDGRCRSCVSDAECTDEPDNQDPKCTPNNAIPDSRGCYGVAGSRKGDAVPNAPKK